VVTHSSAPEDVELDDDGNEWIEMTKKDRGAQGHSVFVCGFEVPRTAEKIQVMIRAGQEDQFGGAVQWDVVDK